MKSKGKYQKANGKRSALDLFFSEEGQMDKNDLGERLLDFAVRVIKLVGALPNTIAGRRIGDQLLRSGTSPGANYEEAQGAESHADFTHKLQL